MKTRNWWIIGFSTFIHVLLKTLCWKKRVVQVNFKMISIHNKFNFETLYNSLISHFSQEFLYWIFNYSNVQYTSSTLDLVNDLKKGGILLTAHMGNWEQFGSSISDLGIPIKASYQPLKSKWANSILLALRERKNQYAVDLTSNPMSLKSLIENKSLITFMMDQDYRKSEDFTTSTFFNHPVACNPYPLRLQEKFHLPVYVGWSFRDKNSVLWIHIQKVNTSYLSEYHRLLEQSITEHPQQWAGWTHRRFQRLLKIY